MGLSSNDEIVRDDILQIGIIVCAANISRDFESASDSMNSSLHISRQYSAICDLSSLDDSETISSESEH